MEMFQHLTLSDLMSLRRGDQREHLWGCEAISHVPTNGEVTGCKGKDTPFTHGPPASHDSLGEGVEWQHTAITALMLHFSFYGQQPHKNQMWQGYTNKVERKRFQSLATPKPALSVDGAKKAAARRACTHKIQRTPQVNSRRVMSRRPTLVPLALCASAAAWYSLCWIMRWAGKQKKRGGDSLSRKRATAARVSAAEERHVWSAQEDSDRTRLFGQMAEEGVRTVLRDFSEKVQSQWHWYKRQQTEKDLWLQNLLDCICHCVWQMSVLFLFEKQSSQVVLI